MLPGVVAHAFNPSIWGGRDRRISEFEASLVYRYRVSSRTATQRNPVSKNQKKKKKKKKERENNFSKGENSKFWRVQGRETCSTH